MTPEKHPLETVRDVLEFYASGTFALVHENRFLEWGESNVEITSTNVIGHRASEALNILNHYLCQTQSCAECERLGREMREAVRDLAETIENVWYSEFSNNKTCLEGQQINDVLEKHAATIAAAGGGE